MCMSVWFSFSPMAAYRHINSCKGTMGFLLWPSRKSCIHGIAKPSDVGIWHFHLFHKSMLLMHPCSIQLYYCTQLCFTHNRMSRPLWSDPHQRCCLQGKPPKTLEAYAWKLFYLHPIRMMKPCVTLSLHPG